MTRRLLFIGLMITTAIAENKRLSFEDVQGNSPFEYARLGMMQWQADKNAYLAWGKGDYKGDIVEVAFPAKDTTKIVDEGTLVVNGEKLKVSRFFLDKTGTKLLLLSNREKIWRHSYYGTYHVLDVATQTIEQVSTDNTRLRNVKMSPDGSKVAYVREDNNLYVYDLNRNREKQLTTNGSELILNGHFGWVYEEEFGSYDAYRWSQDSQQIAFWEINQSKVPVFTMFDELSLYPTTQEIRYPKAGQTNPTMSIFVVNVKNARRKKMNIGDNHDMYYPWMEWTGQNKLTVMRMNRLQNHWEFLTVATTNGKSVSGLTESDPSGWVELHRHYHFLENGNILWVSERSGWHHIYIHSAEGQLVNQVTDGEWEVKGIKKVDEANQKVYFMANKESTFENRFYSVNFDGTGLKLLTKEPGSHSVRILPQGDGFIDSYSSLITPSKHILKDMDGNIQKILGETDQSQFEAYDLSYP